MNFRIRDQFEIAGFRFPGGLMGLGAAIPGVYSIQPIEGDWQARAEVSDQINVNNLDELNIAYPGYRDWLSFVNLDGTGVTFAVVDEGIDELHPDLAGSRLPCSGATCTTAPSNHGTHVAGIVTGNGSSAVTDGNGFLRGLGVAPESKILEQELIMFRFLAGGVFELIADSSRNGATISNNSWGTSASAKGYNADALMIDAGVRDANPAEPGNQPLFYVQAFGNGNGGVSSQGAPDEAKNTLVVGSTWAGDIDANPNPNVDSLSDNSAHGPALDGRRIPHLVAPGCYVDTFLMSNRSVEVQFWLDISSRSWFERLFQPLTHPYVLSRNWHANATWTDDNEYQANQETLYRLVLGLLHRCRTKIYLGLSDLNEQGYQDQGTLLKAVQRVLRGASAGQGLRELP